MVIFLSRYAAASRGARRAGFLAALCFLFIFSFAVFSAAEVDAQSASSSASGRASRGVAGAQGQTKNQPQNQSQTQLAPASQNPPAAASQETLPETSFIIPQETEDTGAAVQPIGIWDTVRVFFVLILVIAGIYGVVWVLKKIQKRSFANPQIIDVLSSKQLSGGGNVHVIKLGKSVFFVGASGQTVNLMKEIKDKEEIDEIMLALSFAEEENDASAPKSFAQSLKNSLRKIFKSPASSAAGGPQAGMQPGAQAGGAKSSASSSVAKGGAKGSIAAQFSAAFDLVKDAAQSLFKKKGSAAAASVAVAPAPEETPAPFKANRSVK